MPKKKKVDLEKLIKAIEDGMPRQEIMSKFGIKTSSQLNSLYLEALVAKDRVKDIVSSRGGGGQDSKEVRVNARGSLVIPREAVEEMGFNVEDVFVVRKTKSGVSLRKS